MVLVDIFGELFDYDLRSMSTSHSTLIRGRTFELFGTRGSLPGEARE